MNLISNPLILVLVIDFSYQSNQSKLNGKKVFFKNRKGEAAEINTANIPTATISEIEEDSFFIGNDPCCQIEGLSFSNYYYTTRCFYNTEHRGSCQIFIYDNNNAILINSFLTHWFQVSFLAVFFTHFSLNESVPLNHFF